MIKTQKYCADLLVCNPPDALKCRISKLRRSSSNIIIMLRCAKGRNSKLRRFTLDNYSVFATWKTRGKWRREVMR